MGRRPPREFAGRWAYVRRLLNHRLISYAAKRVEQEFLADCTTEPPTEEELIAAGDVIMGTQRKPCKHGLLFCKKCK
jgi:hypothetical protein